MRRNKLLNFFSIFPILESARFLERRRSGEFGTLTGYL